MPEDEPPRERGSRSEPSDQSHCVRRAGASLGRRRREAEEAHYKVRERGAQASTHAWPSSRDSLVRGAPGLLLDDQVRLDGEDASTVAQIEQLDQLRVD